MAYFLVLEMTISTDLFKEKFEEVWVIIASLWKHVPVAKVPTVQHSCSGRTGLDALD